MKNTKEKKETKKTNDSGSVTEPSLEQVYIEQVSKELVEFLKEKGVALQTFMTGYPHEIKPVVRLIKLPDVQETQR